MSLSKSGSSWPRLRKVSIAAVRTRSNRHAVGSAPACHVQQHRLQPRLCEDLFLAFLPDSLPSPPRPLCTLALARLLARSLLSLFLSLSLSLPRSSLACVTVCSCGHAGAPAVLVFRCSGNGRPGLPALSSI